MTKKLALLFLTLIITTNTWAEPFERPPGLQAQVDFWTKIYNFYDSNQVVFHDQEDPRIIYAVLDLPRINQEISAPKFRNQVQKRYKEIESVLDNIALDQKPEVFLDDWQRIHKMLAQKNMLKNPDLKKRLRSQSGLRSQFALGLKNSGRFIDEMKAILRAQKLPEELIALVFVESMFFLSVTSHAGASGPWGIMKETALRSGIYVNNFTDERMDPVVSTLAAAQFLKKAKEGLGKWPLAITAYNYGYAGMLRAVSNLGTQNIEDIIAKHDSPIFGFACKNYYAEFLAALDVYNQREKYFPDVKPEQPWRYEIVQVQKPVHIGDIISARALDKHELINYNPGLSKRTLDGHEVIPASYALRIPHGKSKQFYSKLKAIPKAKHDQAEQKISFKYRSNGKESLSAIARKHGLREEFLAKKLKASVDYQPKGLINIRSHSHIFSELNEISKTYFTQAKPAPTVASKKAPTRAASPKPSTTVATVPATDAVGSKKIETAGQVAP